ncbi:type I methionyl aminopeptidase [Candidatus Microgenomates bacterium]|nr:type I methionyl aminopeptidase [Candidatus Microgenomates bacterium]
MIIIKTPEEIEIMHEAGKMLARVKDVVHSHIRAGITLAELDEIAEAEMIAQGGEPAFKRVYGYKYATCINVNDGVVHGIPNNYEVQSGDKVSIDAGVFYEGFNTDSAFTVAVEPVTRELAKFVETGKKLLDEAIAQAKPGKRVGHISKVIHEGLKKAGYSPSMMFTGHGIGRDLHEDPAIPCFFAGNLENTPLLKEGIVIAVEVIYCAGSPDIKISSDGWTARTKDGKIGGLFEETVAITKDGPQVLTR